MLVYYLLGEKEIVDIMSSKIVELNITNGILYSKMPKLNSENMALRFELRGNEKKDLIRLKSSVYKLNRGINLEGRNFKIILNDRQQEEYIRKTSLLYKEIKFSKANNKNICLKYLKENDNNYNENNRKERILQEYELLKEHRVNKIKGMLYGISAQPGMVRKYILEKFPVYYKQLKEIINIIEELRNNKMLDKGLLKNFNHTKKALENRVICSVNNLDKKELIFKFNEKKRLVFNENFLDLSSLEKQIFEFIINKLVDNDKKINDREILANVIIETNNIIKNNDKFKQFSHDMKLILDRVYEKNYDTDIQDIKSVLFKNIYATYIKYNNLKEFYLFLDEKQIEKKYIATAIYGACIGFKHMSYSSVLTSQMDSLSYEVIKSSLVNIENNFYDLSYNIIYNKNKINYFLNEISFYIDKVRKCGLQYADVRIKDVKNHIQMNINTEQYGTMIIDFYERKKNMSRNIRYFDNKIERVKMVYKNFNYNKSVYFCYYFIKNKNIRLNNLQQEYYFSVILKNVYDSIKLNRGEAI